MNSSIQPIGRFVTRPSGTGKPDIMIGSCFKDQSLLKENTVYEIVNIMGTIIIKEVGKSWIPETNNSITWAHSIEYLMSVCGNKMILTETEFNSINK